MRALTQCAHWCCGEEAAAEDSRLEVLGATEPDTKNTPASKQTFTPQGRRLFIVHLET